MIILFSSFFDCLYFLLIGKLDKISLILVFNKSSFLSFFKSVIYLYCNFLNLIVPLREFFSMMFLMKPKKCPFILLAILS